MEIKNSTFAKRIASKFIDSSLIGNIFLIKTKMIIKLSLIILTTLFCILIIKETFTSGRIPSITTLIISLIIYSVAIMILIKLTPFYAKTVQKRRIESYIQKCVSTPHSKLIISSSKFDLFTSVSTDNQLFSDIKYANRVSQIENVVIELHKPSYTKGGTLLVITIFDLNDTEQQLCLEKTLAYIKQKEIAFDYQP